MSTHGVRAVIFDMDGVLLDSYQAHFESWQRIAGDSHINIDEETFARTFGRTSRDIISELWPDDASGNLTDERIREIDDMKETAYREIVAADFPAMPGVHTLIDGLHAKGFSLAVGSSGPPANVDLVLDRLDRRNKFQAMVTGKDVTKGKPDPEVFLKAAEKLGVAPERCAVVEDAAPGIEAANRAGMVSIGLVSTGRTREELAAANPVHLVTSLLHLNASEIAELIDRHAARQS